MNSLDAQNPLPIDSRQRAAGSKGGLRAMVIILLGVTLLMMRVPGLLALPIFGDEAIYLRWAQLVRGEGVSHRLWWVSLADPKPPLHYWLLAWVFRWGGDPLWAGRMLSVLLGAVGIPVLIGVGAELGRLRADAWASTDLDQDRTGWAWGVVSAILLIFCPFAGFHQRLATAESLFLGESLLIVWLSLRWARLSMSSGPDAAKWQGLGDASWKIVRGSWGSALALGVVIGLALMTRQGVSYTLCAMPLTAWIVAAVRQGRQGGGGPDRTNAGHSRIPWGRSAIQLALLAVIAGAIWAPYLVAELRTRALDTAGIVDGPQVEVTRAQVTQELQRRILYQGNFTQSEKRLPMIWRNIKNVFVPTWDRAGDAETGWLFLYLTPVVLVLCLGGLIYLVIRGFRDAWAGRGGAWAVPVILVVWLAVTLGPVIVLGNVVFSRYVLTAVPPLLLAGAIALTDLSGAILGSLSSASPLRWGTLLVLWGAVIGWPMKAMATQASTWWEQTLTVADRYQYITGWPAGYGTQAAIGYVAGLANAGPVVLITDNGWGNPADAAWVYLSDSPGVTMLYTTDPNPILRQVPKGTATTTRKANDDENEFRLRTAKWFNWKDQEIRLPAGVPVLYLTNDPIHANGEQPAEQFLRAGNLNLQVAKTFKGVEVNGRPNGEGVTLFLVSRPEREAAGDLAYGH